MHQFGIRRISIDINTVRYAFRLTICLYRLLTFCLLYEIWSFFQATFFLTLSSLLTPCYPVCYVPFTFDPGPTFRTSTSLNISNANCSKRVKSKRFCLFHFPHFISEYTMKDSLLDISLISSFIKFPNLFDMNAACNSSLTTDSFFRGSYPSFSC